VATRVAITAACLWFAVSSIGAHPDYLPWMNALAGRHPEHVLLDSNYDWGQDLWRLARICQARGITSIGYSVTTGVRPANVGITSGHKLDPTRPSRGWLVLSDQNLELARTRDPLAFDWLTCRRSFERVGKTLRLYHVP
jgi:hypothetical protein